MSFAAEGNLAVDSPTSRLEESRGDIAKAWLMRVVERKSLEDIERLPTGRIARELPQLISEIIRAAGRSDADSAAVPLEWALQLGELSGDSQANPKELVRDLAVGQKEHELEVLWHFGPELEADAVGDVLTARTGEAEWLGTTDSLTGLHNSRYMQEHLHHLLGVQKRYGHPFAVLLLDIDGLKRINDAYGSDTGDRTLVGVATALGESLRNVDTPARMGGDEFCILLPQQTASRAKVLADRLAANIERVESPAPQPLRVSIGVVSCPQHATEAEDLLELADGAMYRAKAAGESVAIGETVAGSANGDLVE